MIFESEYSFCDESRIETTMIRYSFNFHVWLVPVQPHLRLFSSPGSYEVGSRRSASPEVDMRVRTSSPLPNRSSSPRANRTYPAQLNRSSSPRLQRSSSPRLHRSSSPTRSSSPSTRHTTPRSPIIGYSRSPRLDACNIDVGY